MREMTTLRLAFTLLLLALFSAAAEAAGQKRVLIIHSFGRDFAPDAGTASTLRAELTQSLRQPLALQEASLDVERGGGPENEGPLVEYLLRRTRDAPPDLVIAFSAPAMFFALRHRDALFPDRPLLVSGVDRQLVGQVAANIRGLKKPDPYKNKGIRYTGERLKKKAGKAGGK